MLADQALARFLEARPPRAVDIGSGGGEHARRMRAVGIEVLTVDRRGPADRVAEFMALPAEPREGVWCSHVLEHQLDPHGFLQRLRQWLLPGGLLALTVPPLKHNLVSGHLTLWNAGLLLYHLVLAGFDCRDARLGSYGYNISVLMRRADAELPEGEMWWHGNFRLLNRFLPVPFHEGIDGRLGDIGW